MEVKTFAQVEGITGATIECLDEDAIYCNNPPKHAIVAVEDYINPPRIIVLGANESDALLNLVKAIVFAFSEGEFGLDEILNAGGYPDFSDEGALIGADFVLGSDSKGWHYTIHIGFGEDGKAGFEFRHVPHFESITEHETRTDNVPDEIYMNAIRTLAGAYLGA